MKQKGRGRDGRSWSLPALVVRCCLTMTLAQVWTDSNKSNAWPQTHASFFDHERTASREHRRRSAGLRGTTVWYYQDKVTNYSQFSPLPLLIFKFIREITNTPQMACLWASKIATACTLLSTVRLWLLQKGPMDILVQTVRKEGFFALYKGVCYLLPAYSCSYS